MEGAGSTDGGAAPIRSGAAASEKRHGQNSCLWDLLPAGMAIAVDAVTSAGALVRAHLPWLGSGHVPGRRPGWTGRHGQN